MRIKLPLTHEEIAEFIGTTRETVTRTLSEFKSQHLVELRGSTLLIENREALEGVCDGLAWPPAIQRRSTGAYEIFIAPGRWQRDYQGQRRESRFPEPLPPQFAFNS